MIGQKAPIIVDTNILFSALLREKSRFSELLLDSNYRFFICKYIFLIGGREESLEITIYENGNWEFNTDDET